MTESCKDCIKRVDKENNIIEYEQKYSNGQIYWSIYNGYNKKWFDNGQLWKEYYVYNTVNNNTVNNKMDKYYKEWYSNGQIYKYDNYKDGMKDGISTTWYEDGKIESQTIYKNDFIIEEKQWYENGQLHYIINYKDEKYNGQHIEYHPNGVLKFKINLIEDEKDGDYLEYDENGQLILETKYKNGKLE